MNVNVLIFSLHQSPCMSALSTHPIGTTAYFLAFPRKAEETFFFLIIVTRHCERHTLDYFISFSKKCQVTDFSEYNQMTNTATGASRGSIHARQTEIQTAVLSIKPDLTSVTSSCINFIKAACSRNHLILQPNLILD